MNFDQKLIFVKIKFFSTSYFGGSVIFFRLVHVSDVKLEFYNLLKITNTDIFHFLRQQFLAKCKFPVLNHSKHFKIKKLIKIFWIAYQIFLSNLFRTLKTVLAPLCKSWVITPKYIFLSSFQWVKCINLCYSKISIIRSQCFSKNFQLGNSKPSSWYLYGFSMNFYLDKSKPSS